MSIGAVLEQLRAEFPEVTISKLRFLEEQGLVTPERAPSGYRKYSQAHVERVRYVLAAQRDSYLPLKVIRERLDELDSGRAEATPQGRIVEATDGATRRGDRLSLDELVLLADVDEHIIDALIEAGVLEAVASGRFDAEAVAIARAAGALIERGMDARHLRSFRTAAGRQVDLVAQMTEPVRRQGRSDAKASADTAARELAELCAELHRSLLRSAIGRL